MEIARMIEKERGARSRGETGSGGGEDGGESKRENREGGDVATVRVDRETQLKSLLLRLRMFCNCNSPHCNCYYVSGHYIVCIGIY
jgi:allantoicase